MELDMESLLLPIIYRMEKMSEKDWWIKRLLHRHSWPIPQRHKIPWVSTQVRLDWSSVQRNGWLSSRRSYSQGYERGARSTQIILVFTVEWFNIQWTNGSSRWLQSSSLLEKSLVQTIGRLPKADHTAVSRPTTKSIASSQKHIVEVLGLVQKLGGNFGQIRRLLPPGGRVIIGMNFTITTHNTWLRIRQGTKKIYCSSSKSLMVTHAMKGERARTRKPCSLSDFSQPCGVRSQKHALSSWILIFSSLQLDFVYSRWDPL